jgi:hypothetical protein
VGALTWQPSIVSRPFCDSTGIGLGTVLYFQMQREPNGVILK